MRRVWFVLGYGLLPLWGAIVVVIGGGLVSNYGEYWAVAPWLIIASIPICGATVLAASVTLVVHARTTGDESSKYRAAVKAFWALNALIAALAGAWWLRHASLERDLEHDKKLALEFVRGHATVIQQGGRDAGISLSSYSLGSEALPVKYEFSIETGPNPASRYVYAIVSAAGSADNRRFSLACITPISLGQRESGRDPCK